MRYWDRMVSVSAVRSASAPFAANLANQVVPSSHRSGGCPAAVAAVIFSRPLCQVSCCISTRMPGFAASNAAIRGRTVSAGQNCQKVTVTEPVASSRPLPHAAPPKTSRQSNSVVTARRVKPPRASPRARRPPKHRPPRSGTPLRLSSRTARRPSGGCRREDPPPPR